MDIEDFYLEDLKTKFNKINPNEYYLSYSGGKDSHLLYWFIKEYAPEFSDIKVVGINTFMEHEEIRQRMYKNCDIVLMPEMKPFEIKKKYGIPCFTKTQDEFIYRYQNQSHTESLLKYINGYYFKDNNGNISKSFFCLNKKAKELLLSGKLHKISNKCCTKLKKEPARKFEKDSNLHPILGVRANESQQRKSQYKSCFTKDKKFTPLWDLTDEIEEKIYKKYNIEIPSIYKYVNRTGCMGCPYGFKYGDTIKELSLLNESQKNFCFEYFRESYNILGIKEKK